MGSKTETAGFSKMNEGSVKWGMYEVMMMVVMQQETDETGRGKEKVFVA
jgi:hypothetical protein